MPDELTTYAENTWCRGCGNFAIQSAMKAAVKTLGERGIGRDRIVITAGIGCHAKIFDYLGLSGLYSLHGRAMATAQGFKLANPDLRVIAFCGDGDSFGEGLAHTMFAAKRNADITMVMHDNEVYALTTGQRTPTSPRGFKGPSTPHGNPEDPFNPLVLMLEAGATFVARGYSGELTQLADLIVAAVEHEGFSFIQVLQPSVTFTNTYDEYNEKVEVIEGAGSDFEEALRLARASERLPTGILYRTEKTTQERALYGDRNPIRDRLAREKRLDLIRGLLSAS